MPDISSIPTQDLLNIAKGGQDISKMSNSDLMSIAKGQSEASPDAQAFSNQWNAISQQAVLQSQPQSALASRGMLEEVGAGLARGIVKGGQSVISTGVNAYELSSRLFGGHPSNMPREFLQESQQGLNELIPPTNSFAGSVAQGLGELPTAIGTFMNPVAKSFGAIKLAAILGAVDSQQSGSMGMIGGALSGATQMALLGKAQTMNVIPGMALGAATVAAPAVLAGENPQDIAAQATLGAGFAAWKPTSIKEVGEFVSNVRDVVKNPTERWEMFKDALTTDPVAIDTQKINDELTNIRNSEAGLGVQEKEGAKVAKQQFQIKGEQNDDILKQLLSKEDTNKLHQINEIERQIEDSANALKTKIDTYNNRELPEEAFAQAKYVQRNLPIIQKQASEIYNKRYDEVARTIDEKTPITRDTATELLTKAAQKIVNDTADENDRVLLKVHKLLEGKYSSDPIIGTDRTGRIVKLSDVEGQGNAQVPPGRLEFMQQTDPELYKSYLKNKGGNVSFGEFHSDLKRIWNSIPLGSDGSHSAGLLRHTFGDYISTKVPAFQALQDSYRPVLDYHSFLNKVFQPMKTEANLEQGTKFLQQFAQEGGASPVDKRVLEYLQHGRVENKPSGFSAGIGDAFMKEITNMGSRLQTMQEQYHQIGDIRSAKLTAVAQQFADNVAKLKDQHLLTDKQLENQKSLAIDNLQMEIARQRMEFELRKNDLNKQKENIHTEKAHRESHEGLYRALSLGIGSVWSYKITRAMQGLLVGEKALRKSK